MFLANIQSSTLSKHDSCIQHKDAVSAHAARCQLYKTDAAGIDDTNSFTGKHKRAHDSDDDDNDATSYQPSDGELALFRTVYYAANHDLPNSQVNSLASAAFERSKM